MAFMSCFCITWSFCQYRCHCKWKNDRYFFLSWWPYSTPHTFHFTILDDCERCPLGPLKSPFSPNRVLRFPLCSFFPFSISLSFLFFLPSQCRTCGAVIVGGWLARSPRLKLLFFSIFSSPSSLSLSLSTSSPFLLSPGYFVLILPPVVFSVSTRHTVVSLTRSFSSFTSTLSPPLIPTLGLLCSPATCSRQWFAPDMPRHVRAHAGRRQTET